MKPLRSPKDKDNDSGGGMHSISDAIRALINSISRLVCSLDADRLSRKERHKCHSNKNRGGLSFAFGLPHQKKESNPMPVEITLTNEQKIVATLNPKTDTGKPAKVDPNNPPVWSVVSGNGTVVPAADFMSAELVTPDDAGDTIYLVDADADLGEGKESLQDTITLHTTGANAKNLGITLGSPIPK